MAAALDRAVEASEIVDALKPFGVTQLDVAAVTQVSDRAVRGWRTGDIRPDRYDRLAQLRDLVLLLSDSLTPRGVGQWLRDYRPGRELYAIGSNPEGARLAGVRSDRRVLVAFVLAGALAGLGGVLFTARFGTVDATAGAGYELTVIAAAVVGGVAIFGGTGSVYGAALGALLLGTITSSLIVLKVEAFWQQAAVGALLLTAITVDRLLALRVEAALRRRSARRAS